MRTEQEIRERLEKVTERYEHLEMLNNYGCNHRVKKRQMELLEWVLNDE